MKNKKVKFRLEGAFLTALVLALVILLNLVTGILGDRYDLKFDLTGGGVFTLSDETEEVISLIDNDITIYYATNAESRNSRYTEILEEFKRASDFISVSEVNIDIDPGFIRQYQIKNYNSVVVESASTGKKRVVDGSMIEQGTINDNGIENNKVNYLEGYVSAAIRYVTSDDPLMIYIAMGHGEVIENPSMLDYLMNMLYTEGMSVKIIDISTDKIPNDADMLLFAGSTKDFTDNEIKKIDDYLETGGRVQFYSNPSYELPDINSYFEKNWSVKINNDCVSDKNAGYIAQTPSGNYLMPNLEEHAMTSFLRAEGTKLRVMEGDTNSIKVTEEDGIEANVLVATGESGVSMTREAWAAKNKRENYTVSEEGKQKIVVYLRKNPLYNTETSARLMVSGSYYMLFDRYYDASGGYGDKDFVVKSINYMSGIEDAPVSIASKNVVKEKMEILDQNTLVLCIVLLAGVIPAIMFAYGIYVYVRRHRL
ncbi:MAG: GldG family protein [Clostridia bacterium]|nr:GldG family protein [Clostridia bacterium]